MTIKRIFLMLCAMGIAIVMAIVVREAIEAVISSTGFISNREAAFIGLAPVVYFIFKGFVNPVKGLIRGDDPEVK